MRARLRGWFGTILARLRGPSEVVSRDNVPGVQPLLQCTHPYKALTACTYYAVGPKGKGGWFYRCRNCLAWFSC